MNFVALNFFICFCCCCVLAKTELIINNFSSRDSGVKAIIFQAPCLRWHHSGRCLWPEYRRFQHNVLKQKVAQPELVERSKERRKTVA